MDPAKIEAAVQQAVDDVGLALLEGVTEVHPSLGHVDPQCLVHRGPSGRPLFQGELELALDNYQGDDNGLQEQGTAASRLLGWSIHHLPEPNPRILARAATQVACDLLHRRIVTEALGVAGPSISWQAGSGFSGGWGLIGGGVMTWGIETNNDMCIGAPFRDLAHLTLPFETPALRRLSVVQPYLGVSEPAPEWKYDPACPPLETLRFAAGLLRREKSRVVLGLELGHSVAAQALASWLPEATVYSESAIQGGPSEDNLVGLITRPDPFSSSRVLTADESPKPSTPQLRTLHGLLHGEAQADAIVLNLPSPRQHWALARYTSVPRPTGAAEHRTLAIGPERDAHALQDALLEATFRVRPGGLVVALGDVNSGVLHMANDHLRREGFQPICITECGGHIAQVDYAQAAHEGTLAVPPTGRLLSVWRAPA
jgi:hypothetical protein